MPNSTLYAPQAHAHFQFVIMPAAHGQQFRAIMDTLGVPYWHSYSARGAIGGKKMRLQSRAHTEADFLAALEMLHAEIALPALAANLR